MIYQQDTKISWDKCGGGFSSVQKSKIANSSIPLNLNPSDGSQLPSLYRGWKISCLDLVVFDLCSLYSAQMYNVDGSAMNLFVPLMKFELGGSRYQTW